MMVRWLNALLLTSAVVALSMGTTSCTSNGIAQLRVINAIPNSPSAFDVQINGSKAVTKLEYDTVDPTPATPAAYFGQTAGQVTLEVFYTGQTVNPIINTTTANLIGGDYYTILLGGYTTSPPFAYLISDDNKPAQIGTVKIRVINASASAAVQYPGGFDVYILPPGQPISGIPQVIGLTLGQAGPGYTAFNYLTSYVVWVTPHSNTTPLIPAATIAQSSLQVTTLVIVDKPDGSGISSNLLTLIDQQ